MESSVLEDAALNAFCRQKELYTHHLDAWKKAFLLPQQPGIKIASERVLRDQVKQLEKGPNRQVPVRQWVLSFPKRLRYFLARDADLLNRVCPCTTGGIGYGF
ncbi:MAG: hypothetical protein V3V31_00245 [Methylococcales bacterium]